MSEQTHSIVRNGKKLIWRVDSLWKHIEQLTPFEYEIASCTMLNEDCWFGDRYVPSVRRVLEHYEKISKSDLTYPIILSEDAVVMDGLHRICKAILEGKTTILAVQFTSNPKPDIVETLL